MNNVYWDLSDPQMAHALRQVVQGRDVIEIGGGAGALAEVMVCDMMAESVLVIEKETMYRPQIEKSPQHLVAYYWGYVQDFARDHRHREQLWPAAVLSFPPCIAAFDVGAVHVLKRSAIVAVLGKNDGVTAVGTSLLWKHLTSRERINLVVGSRNDLVVYGPNPRPPGQTMATIEHYGLQYDVPELCLTTSRRLLPARN